MVATSVDIKTPREVASLVDQGILTDGSNPGEYIFTERAFEEGDYGLSAQAAVLRSRTIITWIVTDELPI